IHIGKFSEGDERPRQFNATLWLKATQKLEEYEKGWNRSRQFLLFVNLVENPTKTLSFCDQSLSNVCCRALICSTGNRMGVALQLSQVAKTAFDFCESFASIIESVFKPSNCLRISLLAARFPIMVSLGNAKDRILHVLQRDRI